MTTKDGLLKLFVANTGGTGIVEEIHANTNKSGFYALEPQKEYLGTPTESLPVPVKYTNGLNGALDKTRGIFES